MPASTSALDELHRRVRAADRIVALTGAGCSTDSGIPDYRDDAGAWKRKPPVFYADFVRSEGVRRRYWARSLVGWPSFASARPNAAHVALADLEASGRLHHVVTQNVDGLHQRAGSRRVIDLHGRLDQVACLSCGAVEGRERYQGRLADANPAFAPGRAARAPDGDADLPDADVSALCVPECTTCGGVLKPSVVFFGENVPGERVRDAYARVADADLLLVAGTSLRIFSGWRFVAAAAERGTPVVIVNRGATRGDDVAALRVGGSVGEILGQLVARLGVPTAG